MLAKGAHRDALPLPSERLFFAAFFTLTFAHHFRWAAAILARCGGRVLASAASTLSRLIHNSIACTTLQKSDRLFR